MADLSTEQLNKFKEITESPYYDQAKWFLNAFWSDGAEAHAEEVWELTHKFIDIDPKKKAGNELDQVLSAHFLQSLGEPMTALQLKDKLRDIDADANGMMALLEYFLFKYEKGVVPCIDNPQGGSESDKKELDETTAKLEQLSTALAELQVQLEQQKKAQELALETEKTAVAAKEAAAASEATAKEAEAEALDAERKASDAEAVLVQAEEAARAAADDLKRQQDLQQEKIAALEAKIADDSLGIVARNKAVQELAMAKGEDPLPLQRAKITQDAAVRKVEAERKVASAAREKAEEERKAAEVAREKAEADLATAEAEAKKAEEERAAAEEATKRTDAAVKDTEEKMTEAQVLVEELKKRASVAHGSLWWMDRELAEAKKYLPKKKQQA